MPGTIQVSVLELIESPPNASAKPSDAKTSSLSLKVALGKREYQTMGNGELSFPVASLRENLALMLYDLDGNLMSRTEFKTMSVVEKGILDSSLSIEGGGIIHLRLQFLLSQEERLRIHELRNSKLRSKRELIKEDLENKASGTKDAELLPTYNVERKLENSVYNEGSHQSSTHSLRDSDKHLQDSFDSESCKANGTDKEKGKIMSVTEATQETLICPEKISDPQGNPAASLFRSATEDTSTLYNELEDQSSDDKGIQEMNNCSEEIADLQGAHAISLSSGSAIGKTFSSKLKDQIKDNLDIQAMDNYLERNSDYQGERVVSLTSANVTEETTTFSNLEDQQSDDIPLARSTGNNVRTMISVFESSPPQGLSSVGSGISLISKNQTTEGSLKRISSEESIEKKLLRQTMVKSFSSETLLDINSQNKFSRSHVLKKEGKQYLDHGNKTEIMMKENQLVKFDQMVKNVGSDKLNTIDSRRKNTTSEDSEFPHVPPSETSERRDNVHKSTMTGIFLDKSAEHLIERDNTQFLMSSKDFSVEHTSKISKISKASEEGLEVGVSGKKGDLIAENLKENSDELLSSSKEASGVHKPPAAKYAKEGQDNTHIKTSKKLDLDGNAASGKSDDRTLPKTGEKLKTIHQPRIVKENVFYITDDQNAGKELSPVANKTEDQDKDHQIPKRTKLSRSFASEPSDFEDPCSTGTIQHVFYCRFCRGHLNEQIALNLHESTELLYTRTEEHLFDMFGVWVPQHMCITTGSKQLQNILESCRTCLGSLSVEKYRPEVSEKEKMFSDSSVAVTKCEETQCPGKMDRKDLVGSSNSKARLIDKGVRIIIVIVACGTLLLRTR